MFASLESVLPIPASIGPGYLVALTDTIKSDGPLLLHHFLGRFTRLAAGNKDSNTSLEDSGRWTVAFLGFSQKVGHWRAVSKKLGWDIGKNLEAGTLNYFDGFQMLGQWGLDDDESKKGPEEGASNVSPVTKSGSQTSTKPVLQKGIHSLELPAGEPESLDFILDRIASTLGLKQSATGKLSNIRSNISGAPDSPRLCIMVDDLTGLLDWGFSVPAILDFVNGLRDLASSYSGVVIALAHADTVTLDVSAPVSIYSTPVTDERSFYHSSQTALAQSLRRAADLRLDVVALTSGAGRDVHGQLDVKRGPLAWKEGVQDASYLYKVLDAGLEVFPAGFSKGYI
jgi:hypothetical protein